jgi:RPA family protein
MTAGAFRKQEVLFTVVTRTRYRSPASVITGIAAVIAGIIVVGIILVLIKANQNNDIVDVVLDIGRFFAKPFADLFPQDDPENNILLNWGIAAVAYLIVGAIIARIVRR